MNTELKIPEAIRKAAAKVELFFKLNGIDEWVLMGIQSRNNCREELAAEKLAREQGHSNCINQNDLLAALSRRGFEVSGLDGDESPEDIIANWLAAEVRRAQAQLQLSDYYCRDCREHFRAPREPGPHPKQVACPKGHVHNTYEACRD